MFSHVNSLIIPRVSRGKGNIRNLKQYGLLGWNVMYLRVSSLQTASAWHHKLHIHCHEYLISTQKLQIFIGVSSNSRSSFVDIRVALEPLVHFYSIQSHYVTGSNEFWKSTCLNSLHTLIWHKVSQDNQHSPSFRASVAFYINSSWNYKKHNYELWNIEFNIQTQFLSY